MRWLNRILIGLLSLALLLVLAVFGMFAVLNSQAGRQFAVGEINKLGKSYVHLGGLAGISRQTSQSPASSWWIRKACG